MRKFTAFEISMVIFLIVAFVITWTRNNTLRVDLIPTVINGMVAAISMIVGFSGAIIIFSTPRLWSSPKFGNTRSVIYIVLVAVPIALLWTIYSYLLDGNFDYALRMSMSTLAIASTVLVDFIAYYERETIIQMRENSRRTSKKTETERIKSTS